MRLRISVLIPAVLVISTLAGGALMFWQSMRSASEDIRQEARSQMNLDVTRLQNILYNRLTEDNLQEARLNLSVTAMDASIRSLLLADERDTVLLANRYVWEASPARQVSAYDPAVAARVRGSNMATVAYDSKGRSLMVGYYPVILQLEIGHGMPTKRVGVLYIESSIASKLAHARHGAIARSLTFSMVILATSILVALLLHFLVSRRLARLTRAAEALAAGDMEVRANIGGRDELTQVGGAFDEMVVRIKQDIHRRQAAEQELREFNDTLEQRVAERTALLREAQRIGRIGNWSWDVANDVTSGRLVWSDEIYRIFGYEPGAMEPSYARFIATVHPDDLESVRQSEAAAFSLGHRHSIDHRIIQPDGTIRWVHEEAIATLDAAGNPISLSGTVQDITERKLIEQSLLAAKVEAERANQAKSEFLSRMSHELRTPLNAILGFGQLLELELREGEKADSVQEILHAGRHLLELINEVLDLARIESGRLTLSLESVSLAAIVQECLSLAQPLAEARGIRLMQLDCCAGSVRADRTRLKQVLLNLVSNAIKYNREQGTVSIACVADGDAIQVRISDTGAGLSMEQQSRLFAAFERLEADKSAIEGTGIGLVLSKRLMQLMQGEIGVESTPGMGSTFWIRLAAAPGQAGDASDAEPAKVLDSLAGQAVGQRQFDILCIEDNPANLRLIERILAQRPDIRLFGASAPGLGLELAQAYRPALILLDINLPDMDGYAVLRRLQADAATRAIPVVGISANAMPNDIERAQAAGFVDYLTKPLEVTRFLMVVDAVLSSMATPALPAQGDDPVA